jgi:hypothetical protein
MIAKALGTTPEYNGLGNCGHEKRISKICRLPSPAAERSTKTDARKPHKSQATKPKTCQQSPPATGCYCILPAILRDSKPLTRPTATSKY